MGTVTKRESRLDFPDWMSRWFDESWMPEFIRRESVRVEEFREGDTLVVRAELPGIDPEKDAEITVHDGVLHIRGERSEKTETAERFVYRSEIRYGSFERVVPLPAGTTEADVTAAYRDGVLEVRIPMRAGKPEARKVPVQREA